MFAEFLLADTRVAQARQTGLDEATITKLVAGSLETMGSLLLAATASQIR